MRHGAWVAVLAAVGVLLAGCSEPAQPSTTLPTSAGGTSAEPTPEPLGPADFPVPAEAREQTEDGAVAMATYYLDLLDHVKAEVGRGPVDSDSIRALSDACEVCDQVVGGFDNANASAYVYEGGDLADPEIGAVSVVPPAADIAFTVQQGAVRVLRPDGSEVRTSPETTLRGGIVFEWRPAQTAWVATQLNLTQ